MKGCSKYVSALANNIAVEAYLGGQFLLEEQTFNMENNNKLRGFFSPQANYTDRATAACRRS
jgi:hypothetical protein